MKVRAFFTSLLSLGSYTQSNGTKRLRQLSSFTCSGGRFKRSVLGGAIEGRFAFKSTENWPGSRMIVMMTIISRNK